MLTKKQLTTTIFSVALAGVTFAAQSAQSAGPECKPRSERIREACEDFAKLNLEAQAAPDVYAATLQADRASQFILENRAMNEETRLQYSSPRVLRRIKSRIFKSALMLETERRRSIEETLTEALAVNLFAANGMPMSTLVQPEVSIAIRESLAKGLGVAVSSLKMITEAQLEDIERKIEKESHWDKFKEDAKEWGTKQAVKLPVDVIKDKSLEAARTAMAKILAERIETELEKGSALRVITRAVVEGLDKEAHKLIGEGAAAALDVECEEVVGSAVGRGFAKAGGSLVKLAGRAIANPVSVALFEQMTEPAVSSPDDSLPVIAFRKRSTAFDFVGLTSGPYPFYFPSGPAPACYPMLYEEGRVMKDDPSFTRMVWNGLRHLSFKAAMPKYGQYPSDADPSTGEAIEEFHAQVRRLRADLQDNIPKKAQLYTCVKDEPDVVSTDAAQGAAKDIPYSGRVEQKDALHQGSHGSRSLP